MIDGDDNVMDSATGVTGNASHDAQLSSGASGTTVKKSTFTGNGGEGILVEGRGTACPSTSYSNALTGIRVTGADTLVRKNISGDRNKGNGLDGIQMSGTGGTVSENTARANGRNGIEVGGPGHTPLANCVAGALSPRIGAIALPRP